jgi:P4 family phage/plasmid primase-like protien
MCALYRNKVAKQKNDIESEATSHDKIVKAHYNLIRLAAEGHVGLSAALNEIESFWAEDVIKRDKRDQNEVVSEVWRSRTNALRKIKAQTDERIKIGAAPVDRRCDAPGGPCYTGESASVGTVDTGDGGDPLSDVPRGAIKPLSEYLPHDDDNARHFVDKFSSLAIGPSVRFADGYGWIVWHTGTVDSQPRWELDAVGDQEMRQMWWQVRDDQLSRVENLRQDMVGKINDYASQVPGVSKADVDVAKSLYAEWKKWAMRSGNNFGFENAVKAVRSCSGVTIDVNELDQNPSLLGVQNGVVELDSEDVRKRVASPSDYITLNTHVPWETPSQHASDLWQEYLDMFVPGREEQKALQILLGHCLIGGNPEKVMVVLWGKPNTGKSTLITAIQTALGDYCETVNQSMFQNHKLNPILADAINKRVIVCSEFDEKDTLSASMLKRMTGGHDEVRAEKKGSNARFVGIPQFVMILATNEVPDIPGADKALENRLVPFPFDVTPRKIDKKSANVIKNTCGSAVLNWLIEGYREYRRIGELVITPKMLKSKAGFVSQLDEFAAFANEMIQEEREPVGYVSRRHMYRAFETWWIENKYPENRKPNMRLFTRRLSALGFSSPDEQIRVEGAKDRFWVGVKLRKTNVVTNISDVVNRSKTQEGNDDGSTS